MRYLVTTELKTSIWKKILRFFRLIKKREEFEIIFEHSIFEENDTLTYNYFQGLKVIKKIC